MLKRLLSLSLVLSTFSIPYHSAAQTISTFAGNGTAAFGGDGTPATAAKLNTPYGVAVDAPGNVYITDYENNRIRKVNITTGIISTIAGTGTGAYVPTDDSGPATAAAINHPRGICVDPAGNVVFSDYANNRIRKINTTTGIITTIAGNGGAPAFTGDGVQATATSLGFAWGVTYDAAGNLYIADNQNCRIRKVNTSGIISTIAGNGLCVPGGDGGPASAARVQYPTGVAVDAAGNIYIADDGNNRVRKINTAGIISTIAGSPTYGFSGDGGPSTAAQLYNPRGICSDAAGNVHICDYNNNRIRKINVFGNINTITGNGTAAYGGDGGAPAGGIINQPTGVAVHAASGRVYIADNNNHRIRVIDYFHKPYFVGGSRQYRTACLGTETFGMDTLLAITDVDAGQTETWSPILMPLHGVLAASGTNTSTGGIVSPPGLYYTANTGFVGSDSFSVRVNDGTFSDTTMIRITIVGPPVIGAISGPDSVCPGQIIALVDTPAGGTWGSYNNAKAVIGASSGIVTGVTPGIDTVYYSLSNTCGTSAVIYLVEVSSDTLCPAVGTQNMGKAGEELTVFPNPSHGSFTINVTSGNTEETHFILTNMVGKKVKEFASVTNKPVEIRLEDQAAGIYFLSAANEHNKYLRKIVIER